MYISVNKILLSISCIYFFYAPFAVSNFCEILLTSHFKTSIFIEMLINAIFICHWVFNKKIFIGTQGKIFLILYFIPIAFSAILVPVNLFVIDSFNYQSEYLLNGFCVRVVHVILNFNIFMLFISFMHKVDKDVFKIFLKAYLYGILLMCFFGIWQWGHFNFDIPYIDVETRSYLHSVEGGLESFLIKERITSLTDEPSFLVPFLIDGMIIVGILGYKFKTKIILNFIFLFILLFSYSVGGYLDFLFVCIVGFLTKMSAKKFIYAGIITCVLLWSLSLYQEYFFPVINRVSFDLITMSARYYMLTMPFTWIFEDGLLNVIFGYGPASFKFLSQTHLLPNGELAHVSSNNIFVDYFYEYGMYGLCSISVYFICLIKHFYQTLKINNFTFYSFLFVMHFFYSSLYRGDFMSPRFFVIVLVLIYADKCINSSLKKENPKMK